MEIWVDIVDFEGLYQVSNQGQVRGVDRLGSDGRNLKGKLLKSSLNVGGYPFVILRKNNKSHTLMVHLLVFYSFNDVPKIKNLVVDHKDTIKTNNFLSNLQRITQRENCIRNKKNSDSIYSGVRKTNSKQGKPWAAKCRVGNTFYHVGTFETELEAHLARVEFIKNKQENL